MFSRLSYEQQSKVYGALAQLENVYGKESVSENVAIMIDRLENGNNRQMELLPFEDDFIHEEEKKIKRNFARRNPNGRNNEIINSYFLSLGEDATIAVLEMYYLEGKTQLEIGTLVGVKQRAISQFIHDVPESKKRSILARLKEKEKGGYLID